MSVGQDSTNDDASRSSFNESHLSATEGTVPESPLTETGSLSLEPTDFSGLGKDEIEDEDVLETHPQNGVLTNSGSSRCYIKRPLNAYMIWTRHARDGILKANPHLKMNEVSKTMGEMWKKLPDEDKKPFFQLARKSAMKHKQALEKNPNLAYVPSRKKAKKGDKVVEEPSVKDESKVSPYATPSGSPNASRQQATPAYVAPVQQQPQRYTQQTVVRTAPQPYPAQNHGSPQIRYEYQQPQVSQVAYTSYGQQVVQQQQQIRYVSHHQQSVSSTQPNMPNSYTNGHHAAYQSYPPPPVHGQDAGQFIQNPRDPGTYLVRNPYTYPRTDGIPEPVYEQESPELYKDLYYRSLVQLQNVVPNERDGMPPDFYLQRYYALGGTDLHRSPSKTTNNTNGLVYQEL